MKNKFLINLLLFFLDFIQDGLFILDVHKHAALVQHQRIVLKVLLMLQQMGINHYVMKS